MENREKIVAIILSILIVMVISAVSYRIGLEDQESIRCPVCEACRCEEAEQKQCFNQIISEIRKIEQQKQTLKELFNDTK